VRNLDATPDAMKEWYKTPAVPIETETAEEEKGEREGRFCRGFYDCHCLMVRRPWPTQT